MGNVYVLNHPLIQDKLSRMRRKDTSSQDFRRQLKEIAMLMAYEVTSNFETKEVEIETPICKATFPMLKDTFITIVPIIRAGIGLVDGMLEILPTAHVGFIGMQRDEVTHTPIEYYFKMPPGVEDSLIIIVDPMLATGGSTNDAIAALKRRGCTRIRSKNLVAAPEGIEAVLTAHPDVDIYVAAIDEGLDENAYIVPGLGDAGDRIYGT